MERVWTEAHGIESRIDQRERYRAILWTIRVNWPSGQIRFQSPGFEQQARGEDRLHDEQVLPAGLRT